MSSKLNSFFAAVRQFAPAVLGSIEGTRVLAPILQNAIEVVEAMRHPVSGAKLTGEQKLAGAITLVGMGVGAVNAKRPGTVDMTRFEGKLGDIISSIVEGANLLHAAAQVQDGASVTAQGEVR